MGRKGGVLGVLPYVHVAFRTRRHAGHVVVHVAVIHM